MLSQVAVWAFTTSRRLFQIGILLAGIGGGLVGLAGLAGLARGVRAVAPPGETAPPRSRPLVGPALIAASVLLVAGFVLMILSVHYGVSPWSPRKR